MNTEKICKFGIIAIIVIAVTFLFRENSRQNEIQTHGEITICKLTLCEQRGKSSKAFVKYYVNKKKYRTNAGGCPNGGEAKVNSFFSMKYDKENPNNIVVDFSLEVKDSTLIKELEEKIKFSMYD